MTWWNFMPRSPTTSGSQKSSSSIRCIKTLTDVLDPPVIAFECKRMYPAFHVFFLYGELVRCTARVTSHQVLFTCHGHEHWIYAHLLHIYIVRCLNYDQTHPYDLNTFIAIMKWKKIIRLVIKKTRCRWLHAASTVETISLGDRQGRMWIWPTVARLEAHRSLFWYFHRWSGKFNCRNNHEFTPGACSRSLQHDCQIIATDGTKWLLA